MRKIISSLFIVLFLVSCSDYLNEDNKSGITNEEFYTTEWVLPPWLPLPIIRCAPFTAALPGYNAPVPICISANAELEIKQSWNTNNCMPPTAM